MTKTIEKVLNNEEKPENFDVFYKENKEVRENISINEIFKGETPIENIVISDEAFKGTIIDTFVMPEGIKEIPTNCFFNAKIEKLELPSTIETFGLHALQLARIKTLKIPDVVTEIPVELFLRAKIEQLELPSTIKAIGESAFEMAEIEQLELPSTIKTIGESAFKMAEIKKLELPSTIKAIGESAFKMAGIDKLNIPKGVTKIPVECFAAAKIEQLELPSTIKTIGEGAFAVMEIDTLKIPGDITEISQYCFAGAKIEQLELPSKIETLGLGAFLEMEIDTLKIPGDITEIPMLCFQGAHIKKLILPDKIDIIDEWAFRNAKIDSLYIKNVSSIGKNTFDGFQGMIFTDNSESKAKFVAAGLGSKQVVDLSSIEERFEALKDKTLPEIRELEKDLDIDLWDKNYMQPIEGNLLISDEKGKKFNLSGLAMSKIFQHLTLGQLNQLKNDFSNNLEKESKVGSQKPDGMGKQSMFNSNINRDPGRPSKNPVQKKPRNS